MFCGMSFLRFRSVLNRARTLTISRCGLKNKFHRCPPNQSIRGAFRPYPNDPEHKLLFLATIYTWVLPIGRKRQATPLSIIFCYSKHIGLRFGLTKFIIMYARDKNCRMTWNDKQEKERKEVYTKLRWQERQSAQAFAACACIEFEKGKSLKVPLDSHN